MFDKTRRIKASPVFPAPFVPKGYQQIATATLATSTSLTVPAGSLYARIENNGTSAVRWRDDGTDPTAIAGGRLLPGDALWYDGDLDEIELIREAAGAVLDIHYYA
jgi:hypothetical protein